MKRSFLALVMALGFVSSAFASENALYFTSGDGAGEQVLSGAYVGYYDMCFTGKAYAVKNILYRYISADIEKDGAYVKVKGDTVIYAYTSTKCLDDSLDATVAECRTSAVVPRCQE